MQTALLNQRIFICFLKYLCLLAFTLTKPASLYVYRPKRLIKGISTHKLFKNSVTQTFTETSPLASEESREHKSWKLTTDFVADFVAGFRDLCMSQSRRNGIWASACLNFMHVYQTRDILLDAAY